MKYIFYLIILIILVVWNEDKIKYKYFSNDNYRSNIDEQQRNQPVMWKQLKHGLWKDNLGNIGIKTSRAVSDSLMEDRYIITMGEENKKLKDILDIKTFESVNNSSYYKDKNHVYMHYIMSDGGWFNILEGADSLTFKSIGAIYFKDKKHIYVERNGKIDVDYETFEAFETVGDVCCYAKDKDAYYMWGEKVTDTKSDEFLEIKKILDKQSAIKNKNLQANHGVSIH